MYDTILVPTDGSDHALRAGEHAVALAAGFDAALYVLSVIDLQAAAGPFSAGGIDASFRTRLQEDAEAALESIEEIAGERGLDDVSTDVLEGRPREAILRAADERGGSLVAMGTQGRSGLNRYVAGSVTEHVVRHTQRPVLTARATDRSRVSDGYDEVLVPTDGSEAAALALDHAIDVAERFDARVHALNVVESETVAPAPGGELPSGWIDATESAGETAARTVADDAAAVGLASTATLRRGRPAVEILAYADEQDIDLIVMGTVGRSGLGEFLLGSTTERVLRRAEVPLLAVDARTTDR